MLPFLFCLSASFLATDVLSSPIVRPVEVRSPSLFERDFPSRYSVELAKKIPKTAGALQRRGVTNVASSGPNGGNEYAINITIAERDYLVILDTGSSDLWLHGSNFTCLDANYNRTVPASTCNYGPHGFNASSSNFHPLRPVENLNISYIDQELAIGVAGVDTVTIGNLSVPNATFSVIDEAYWKGDGVTDGLIGLASPYLTSLHNTSDSRNDSMSNQVIYNPWLYQAVDGGLVDPVFSLALNRPTNEQLLLQEIPNLGSITFGGIPDNVLITDTHVVVKNIPVGINPQTGAQAVTEYVVKVDSFNFAGSLAYNTTVSYVALDSGTTTTQLPAHIVEAFNTHVQPPGALNKEGVYIVDCKAKMPDLSLTIGGQDFAWDSRDLIQPNGVGCALSLEPTPEDDPERIYILGDRFLVNVLTVFDIEENLIGIAQRQPY